MDGAARRRQLVVTSDEAKQLITDYMDGRIIDPTDPRGSGLRSTFPGLTDTVSDMLRIDLAKRTGTFRAVVHKVPRDAWSRGYEPVTKNDALKAELQAFDNAVRVWPMLRGFKRAAQETHALARRDQRAILHIRLHDATGISEDEPRGVQRIVELRPIPGAFIKKIDLGEDARDAVHFRQPTFYHVWRKKGDDSTLEKIHADRIIPFIPLPNYDEGEFNGDSELDSVGLSAQATLNIRWASAEAMFQRAAPLLVITLDEDVDDESVEGKAAVAELDENINKLQNHVIQKLRVKKATVEALNQSSSIVDPTPHIRVEHQDIAAGTGIPLRSLTGSEAGALESAKWDEERYNSGVVQPEQESFNTPIVLEWWTRLQRWNLVGGKEGDIEGVHWYAPSQMSEMDRATVTKTVSEAMVNLGKLKVGGQPLPVPDEIQQLLTWGPEVDFDGGLETTQAPTGASPPGGPGSAPFGQASEEARGLRARQALDLVIDRTIELEDQFEGTIRRAIRGWWRQLEDALETAYGKPVRLLAPPDPASVARIILGVRIDDAALQRVIERVLLEAAQEGTMQTWAKLGQRGILQYVDTGDAPNIRSLARDFSRQKAQRVQEDIRSTVAESMAKGHGLTEIRGALRERFGVLENEAAIARTEVMRGFNHGSRAAMRNAGVQHFRFVAYAGADEECVARDGSVFHVEDNLSLPPVHPNCRCTIAAVVPGVNTTLEAS